MVRNIFLTLAVLIIIVEGAAQKTAVSTYRNPIIAGDFADPSVIRLGDTYYAVGTSSEWGPAYPVYTSNDLVNWSYIGPVFATPPAWTMGSFWAPELFYRNGLFYVYYTARRKSDSRSYIGVATTKDIRKGFTDHGVIIEWTTEAIDAFVIEDSGKLYITWKAYGLDKGKAIEILGAELQPDGLKVKGPHFTMLQADPGGWEKGGAEGQAIFKKGDYFYMVYSGNACCGSGCNYQVGLARAKSLKGPWERFSGNPVLVGDDAWKCPGHGTVVTTPEGRYFYLHHAYSGTGFTSTGRQGVLSEMVWDGNDKWPRFRYGKTTPAQAELPAYSLQKNNVGLSVDFIKENDSTIWVWEVSKPKPTYTMQEGALQLTHSATTGGSTFLGMVLKKESYTFSADITPQAGLQQSLCVYGDADNALGFGAGNSLLELWQIKDGKRSTLGSIPITDSTAPVHLQLQSFGGRFFKAGWKDANGKIQSIDVIIDGAFLPRWDRAPRAGISLYGESGTHSSIKNLSLRYN